MQSTIDRFNQFHGAASALFNSLGVVNPGLDACFFGANTGRMARHLMVLSDRLKTDDSETLLQALREIYAGVESEIRGGLPSNCRDELLQALVEGYSA